MVDINLIGDDKTKEEESLKAGDEDRVDEFTQTSSMETQELAEQGELEQTDELAFEERTETFDTTKTAGLAYRRSHSPLMSSLLIFGLIVVLAGLLYWVMTNKGDSDELANIPPPVAIPAEPADQFENTPTQGVDDPPSTPQSLPVAEPDQSTAAVEDAQTTEVVAETPRQPAAEIPPTTTATTRPRTSPSTPAARDYQANSLRTIESVTALLAQVPPTISTTLLSSAGQRVRMEFVTNSKSEAQTFSASLRQYFGSENFTVLHDEQFASNGRALEKVLVSGRLNAPASSSSSDGIQFGNLQQTRRDITSLCLQSGLDLRQFRVQPGNYENGYQRTPILMRAVGAQSAILGFLETLASKGLNIELTKILVVSPDMVTFDDANLVLVANLFLYERN